jgi:XTP/dITP diphosphohydrolase
MKLLIATTNPGKLREMREVLAPLGYRVVGLESAGRALPEPVEDAPTFEGNARIKARAYASALGLACVAEDSGIEVDALHGAPGVHSARYAGNSGARAEQDRANNARLLQELARSGPGSRAARYVCTICVADAGGSLLFETRATCEGVIAPEPRGQAGFGYDPLLLVPELGLTMAQISAHEKNARSHRGQATRALAAWLATHPAALHADA